MRVEVSEILKPPFPWFGGKSRVAAEVWRRFGDVACYVEPFFGSGAVLFGRPHPPRTETVNDLDCYVANFWRATIAEPEVVAEYADWPVNEADLLARHKWLVEREEFRERMKTETDYYDAKIAGWWVWGLGVWIGSGWCKRLTRQRPHLGDNGQGVHRKLPHLRNDGLGVHRKLPHLGDNGRGVHCPSTSDLVAYFVALRDRLRRVRVCCGQWDRVLGDYLTRWPTVGVFLDPPYGESRDQGLYNEESATVYLDVCHWAAEHGGYKQYRIAVCGYEGETEMPGDWECFAWKTRGGYGSRGNNRARENAHRERIWFSPECLQPDRQYVLF